MLPEGKDFNRKVVLGGFLLSVPNADHRSELQLCRWTMLGSPRLPESCHQTVVQGVLFNVFEGRQDPEESQGRPSGGHTFLSSRGLRSPSPAAGGCQFMITKS